MENDPARSLYVFLIQTVEQSCALSPASADSPALDRADGLEELVVTRFSGPMRGRMLLGVRGGLLGRITTGFLDGPEALDRDCQIDALQELANILCGNLLPYVAGAKAVFSISVSRCASKDDWAPAAGEVLFGDVSASYEGGDIFVRLLLESSPSAS
jgi:hypothetical protein